MAETNGHLTPTDRKIIDLLKDGEAHSIDEIRTNCMQDDQAVDSTIKAHISSLRRKLEPKRLAILGSSGPQYRLVRMITTGEY